MRQQQILFPSAADQRTAGTDARTRVPASDHAGWMPAVGRPDPVALLEEQDLTRQQDLIPVRHGRMMASPFTFYRGSAKIMAADLAGTATAGLLVQLCGDAHLSNFGLFGSPERRLVFDLNDFDETLPGPFEYDLKRLTASLVIAARNNGFGKAQSRDTAMASVRAYREAMSEFAEMETMELWYSHMSEADILAALEAARVKLRSDGDGGKKGRKDGKGRKGDKKSSKNDKVSRSDGQRAEKVMAKARSRDSVQALSKLAERVDGHYQIVSQPPVVVPSRDLEGHLGMTRAQIQNAIAAQFRAYRTTLQDDRRRLLERFQVVDVARKVVGVGSVGTGAYIALLQGRGDNDFLFLQAKEASRSVLEDRLPKSRYRNPGERVVQGQRLMQAVSDIYLGWTKGVRPGRAFYWRQLRDMKGSADVAVMTPPGLTFYAELCSRTLARAHARSGQPSAIAAYLGSDTAFDEAITDFSQAYADQNDQDYEAFITAIQSGRIPAVEGV